MARRYTGNMNGERYLATQVRSRFMMSTTKRLVPMSARLTRSSKQNTISRSRHIKKQRTQDTTTALTAWAAPLGRLATSRRLIAPKLEFLAEGRSAAHTVRGAVHLNNCVLFTQIICSSFLLSDLVIPRAFAVRERDGDSEAPRSGVPW